MGKGKKKNRNSFLDNLADESAKTTQANEQAENDAPKLSRKQQRELKLQKKKEAEEARLAKLKAEEEEETAAVQDVVEPPSPPAEEEQEDEEEEEEQEEAVTGGFAALDLDDDEDDEEEESDDSSKKKKKKKEKKEKKEKKAKKEKKEKKSKLSNKERRKLKAAQEAEEREKELAELKGKPTDFSVSQSIVQEDDSWANATDISIPSFTISAFGKTLFQDAELKIAAGRRYGLVGPNGHGKTTLLKLIANGELRIPPSIDSLYVEQEVTADDTPAVDMVMLADAKRTELMEREKEIMDLLENDVNDEIDLEQQDEYQEELKTIAQELTVRGSDSAEARALSLLNGLGFTKDMQRAPTKSFSGGWRMRVSLARALFMEPTLMLLDEPTNHLDLNAVIWLDDYLQKWKKTLLVVSHDQDFLDSVCTDVMHLDSQKIKYYRGNYSQFKDMHEIAKAKLLKEYEKQEKELRNMKQKGTSSKKAQEVLKARAKREGGGAKKKGKGNASQQAESGSSLADRQLIQRPRDYEVNFEFPEPSELGPPIIQVDDISFGYPGGKTLFKKLSFGIDMDSRITIVGNNGVGKTTLLKVITQELEPTKGDVRINRRLKIARYHQHFVDILPMDETPVEYLRRCHTGVTYQEARNKLGKFGLAGSAHTIPMLKLSGGQKARVVFTSIYFQNAHILIFDEPTNNLDIESIDALCEAINEFGGGVVLVSHDARLITSTDCVLWVCEKKTVMEQEGGFESYKDEILAELAAEEKRQREKLMEKQATAVALREQKMKDIAEKRQRKLAKMKSSE